MENEELTLYIGVWFWEIISLLFLCTSLVMFALPRTTISKVLFIGLFLVFIGAQFTSWKRKEQLIGSQIKVIPPSDEEDDGAEKVEEEPNTKEQSELNFQEEE